MLVIGGCSAGFFSSFATAAGFTIGGFAFVFVAAALVPLDFVVGFHAAVGDAVVVGVAATFVASDVDDDDSDSDGEGSFLPTTPAPISPLLLTLCCIMAAPPAKRPVAAAPPMLAVCDTFASRFCE